MKQPSPATALAGLLLGHSRHRAPGPMNARIPERDRAKRSAVRSRPLPRQGRTASLCPLSAV